jgi:hypothetical protein
VLGTRFQVPDGYIALTDNVENPFDSNLNSLIRILSGKYRIFEIECHPNTVDNFDTQFFNTPNVIELIKKHNIVNYNNL